MIHGGRALEYDDDDVSSPFARSATLDGEKLSRRITDLIAEHATRASRSTAGEARSSQGIRLLSCLLSKLTLPLGTQGGAANCELILTSR